MEKHPRTDEEIRRHGIMVRANNARIIRPEDGLALHVSGWNGIVATISTKRARSQVVGYATWEAVECAIGTHWLRARDVFVSEAGALASAVRGAPTDVPTDVPTDD
jgi:hypothetical protein